ncbi:hypothetical protein ACHAXN_005826 [Cyclotella atomus]
MASSSALLTALFLSHLPTLSLSAPESIQCPSAWFPSSSPIRLITLPPSKINDGYCDCPLDGADETTTGACSGSNLWAGVGSFKDNFDSSVKYFVCPQQPSLQLAYSRVDDGICDCCDGADETSGTCQDNCDEVLAAERAARAKVKADYEIGSKIRYDSIAQYINWMGEMKVQLELKEMKLTELEGERSGLDEEMKEAKIEFVQNWVRVVMSHMMTKIDSVTSLIGVNREGVSEHMSVDDLSSFIILMCMLSGEVSNDHVVNGRCVPFDRASIDIGIMWSDDVDGDGLPKFEYMNLESDESVLQYAEKIIALVKGKDTEEWSKNKTTNGKKSRDYDDDDMNRDFLADEDLDDIEPDDVSESQKDEEKEVENGPSVDEMVDSRLKSLHLSRIRGLFKEQADMLLKLTPPAVEEEPEEGDEAASTDETEDEEPAPAFDPAAMNMAKSAINKRLSSIRRGEASAKFAARHIISLMRNRPVSTHSIPNDMHLLALRMIHHSQIRAEDVAEAIYTTSTTFRSDFGVDPTTCPATSPWSSMCPPKVYTGFPPESITNAATRLCNERADAMSGVCTAQENLDVNDFPTTINEGYYNYYSPKERGESDEITEAFSRTTSLLNMPYKLSSVMFTTGKLDKQIGDIKTEIDKLQRDMGGDDANKFGFEGELFILRDTCHSVESGKYVYEVCIFGEATQRDIGQKQGGTNLGRWQTMQMGDDGIRTLKWTDGTKCWNGPQRSAEVVVTCGGSETKLLTADEPETCRYVFTMESPIGCDGFFKANNLL